MARRKKFKSESVKREAVAYVNSGKTVSAAGRKFKVHGTTVANWCKAAGLAPKRKRKIKLPQTELTQEATFAEITPEQASQSTIDRYEQELRRLDRENHNLKRFILRQIVQQEG